MRHLGSSHANISILIFTNFRIVLITSVSLRRRRFAQHPIHPPHPHLSRPRLISSNCWPSSLEPLQLPVIERLEQVLTAASVGQLTRMNVPASATHSIVAWHLSAGHRIAMQQLHMDLRLLQSVTCM